MNLTTEEAAEVAGVTPATLRQWVVRGHLEPVRRGAKPLLFAYDDVARCQQAKRSSGWRQQHAELSARWARQTAS